MAKAVKLADIAERLGVSTVTVSKALSGQKGVSEELRAKIKELAEHMGYKQPSAQHKEKESKSYNLGVICSERYLTKYVSFYWQMYQEVATKAVTKQCFTLMEILTEQAEAEMELPKLIQERKADGLIVIGRLEEEYLAFLNKAAGVPLIYMDFSTSDQSMDAVISDSYYGAYQLTNYLFEMGHTEIAYVGTLLSTGSITDRYLGYVRALMEHGIEVRKEWVVDDRDPKTAAMYWDGSIVLPEHLPTAFLCNCDLAASMVIKKLDEMGYRVPEDISVAGYDNYLYPGLCDVELTSYEVDMKEMARQAVNTLVKKISGENYRKGVHLVEGHIVIKDSVKCIDQ